MNTETSAATILAASFVRRWHLTSDGELFRTPSSLLVPVRNGTTPAILKIPTIEEEQRGSLVMAWWAGQGAARVLAHDRGGLLLERIDGERSLVDMVQSGHDAEATTILCEVAAVLHTPRQKPIPAGLVPLEQWFQALWQAPERYGGVFGECAASARALLDTPQEQVVLHGDLHHGNVLDGGPRGWLAIDPKGLIGERGFDFANIFCNPNYATATQPGRLEKQADVVAHAAHLDRTRLLAWVLSYAGLSAAWSLEDGLDARTALAVAEQVAALQLAH